MSDFMLQNDEGDYSEEEKFLKFIENAANGSITVQDLHAFSIEPRERIDSCKSVLGYILNLRSKTTVML